jgi:Xaa-Pro aminopeptidase
MRWHADPVLLDATRAVQRLAYDCAEAVAAELAPGVTEKEAARRMKEWLRARGVRSWLHEPFAWFGDRTAFHRFRHPLQFFPTSRPLERGMPFILDCAPVVDGVAADIGFSTSNGENREVERIQRALEDHRDLILEGVRGRKPLATIYAEVDALAATQGLENRHRAYPFRVLAHRLSDLPRPGTTRTVLGFGVDTISALTRDLASALREGWSPLWSGARWSAHPATPGLWAVEPHLAAGRVGAKFEEVLVVTEDDAYWLDDDVPHVRGWRGEAPS